VRICVFDGKEIFAPCVIGFLEMVSLFVTDFSFVTDFFLSYTDLANYESRKKIKSNYGH
jgi:hypothetical protein